MKQIAINWIDARSEDGWSEVPELDMCFANITTIGHLVQETADMICVASSLDARTGQVSGIMFIPKVCVLSQHEISVADVESPTERKPDIIKTPGETVRGMLASQNLAMYDLFSGMSWDSDDCDDFIDGMRVITPGIANHLRNILGHQQAFWLQLEADYRAALARIG